MLKAVLIGNLGGDAELRYAPSGQAFLRFTVASNYRARDPQGEWQDRTEWLRVTVFGRRAEALAPYLRRGTKVYVDGRLEARPWTDQQHQPRAGLEVIADEVQLAGGRADDDRQGAECPDGRREPGAAGAPTSRPSGRPADEDPAEIEDLPF